MKARAAMLFVLLAAAFGANAAEPRGAPAQDASDAEQPSASASLELETQQDASVATGRAAARAAAAPAAVDRLELDTTVVTGNRELPKVLYIVPWKKAGVGDLPGQPFNTLLDEVLEPLDRDVFRREVTYYDIVSGGADANQSTSGPPR
ncbi:MAG: hypothetical protein RBS02_11340 [Steroidobacteraceae bacterium]|nr:hypothetical protein [Steroidobacteraceae bacterium]